VYNGYLEGYYPAFTVRDGDHFRAIINCEFASDGCDVLFRIGYKIAGEGDTVKTLWQFFETYEGKYYSVDLDLSSLAGKKIKFILSVSANGAAEDDKPVWVAPRIDRPSNLITPEPTSTTAPEKSSTPTSTPTPSLTPTPPLTVTPTAT
jgi:hypothetical protein